MPFAARITALLGGARTEQKAAYSELTALANGDDAALPAGSAAGPYAAPNLPPRNSSSPAPTCTRPMYGDDAAALLATSTLLIVASSSAGALLEEEAAELMNDEAKLVEVFSRFGLVLAITMHRRQAGEGPTHALLTFDEEAHTKKAADGVSALGLSEHPVEAAEEIERMMHQHQKRVKVGLAAACAPPLATVLCASVSDVGGAEYQVASHLLAKLMLLDPIQV